MLVPAPPRNRCGQAFAQRGPRRSKRRDPRQSKTAGTGSLAMARGKQSWGNGRELPVTMLIASARHTGARRVARDFPTQPRVGAKDDAGVPQGALLGT